MGLLGSITRWLRKESADIGEALDDVTESLDRDLSRKERELAASPEERISMIQDEIADDPFAAIRDRIEASSAHADAEADVDAIDGPVIEDDASGAEFRTGEVGDHEVTEAEIADAEVVEDAIVDEDSADEDSADEGSTDREG
ncbi:MAG: hypothetical protein R2710_04725 [Acidimicrobiales bacterium]